MVYWRMLFLKFGVNLVILLIMFCFILIFVWLYFLYFELFLIGNYIVNVDVVCLFVGVRLGLCSDGICNIMVGLVGMILCW